MENEYGRKARILIVEDDPKVASVLGQIVEQEFGEQGQIEIPLTGEALNQKLDDWAAEGGSYDVLIVDGDLKLWGNGMAWRDWADQLKDLLSPTPCALVLCISGDCAREQEEFFSSHPGKVVYLPKNFKPQEFRRFLREYMELVGHSTK